MSKLNWQRPSQRRHGKVIYSVVEELKELDKKARDRQENERKKRQRRAKAYSRKPSKVVFSQSSQKWELIKK